MKMVIKRLPEIITLRNHLREKVRQYILIIHCIEKKNKYIPITLPLLELIFNSLEPIYPIAIFGLQNAISLL